MNNDKSYFELIELNNTFYPVVTRKRGVDKIDECPYCGERHSHSLGEEHAQSHCTDAHGHFRTIIIKGKEIPFERGYFIKEY